MVGTPEATRTPGLRIRSPLLYPAELPGQIQLAITNYPPASTEVEIRWAGELSISGFKLFAKLNLGMTMLHTELVNNVKIIRIDYGRANAIDRELLDGLIDETSKLSIAGLIITGTGRFFSAGLNLQRVKDYDRPQMRDLMYKFHAFQIGLSAYAENHPDWSGWMNA